MYEILKKLLSAVEQIGTVKAVHMINWDGDNFMSGDQITITGILEDGRNFSINMEVEPAKSEEDANDSP